jgi:hypothetical protein
MERSPSWESASGCSYSRIFQNCLEPEDSLPCSQEPFTGPYPEPDQSSPLYIMCNVFLNIGLLLGAMLWGLVKV